MNRALLNPFEVRDLPKGIEEFLEQPDKATCMRFNRHGNLLAVGTRSGTVVLWDFDTYSIAKILAKPASRPSPVTSVSFPAPCNGSHVLVSYENGLIRVYATLTASVITEVSFYAPLINAVPHPKHFPIIIVVPQDTHPLILHLKRGTYNAQGVLISESTDPAEVTLLQPEKEAQNSLPASPRHVARRPKHSFGNQSIPLMSNRPSDVRMSMLCAKEEFVDGKHVEGNATRRKSQFCVTFTRGGRYMLRGGPSGIVRAFQLTEIPDAPGTHYQHAKCLSAVVIQGKAAIRSIQLSRRGEKVLVNSHDRAMRLFSLDQFLNGGLEKTIIEPKTTFTEIVNKSQCQSACFSRDGDFVLGGMEGTDHRIHVWRTADGFLDLTLEGPREGILEILWHPLRPVIASLGSSLGGVYVWMKNFTENWSAFAAEFHELEANEEYKEAEDEFDLKDPEDDEKRLEAREKAEAKDVDIEKIDCGGWFSSDSDREDTYFFVPAEPKADAPCNYRSLVDEIMTERLEETKRQGARFEKAESYRPGGRGDEEIPGDREDRRRQRSSDLENGQPQKRKKIKLKRRNKKIAGGGENGEVEYRNKESGMMSAVDVERDESGADIELLVRDGFGHIGMEDKVEEEVLDEECNAERG